MKKRIIFYLLSLMVISGCGKKAPAEPSPAPAPVPEVQQQVTEDAFVEEMPAEEIVVETENESSAEVSIIEEEVKPMEFTFNFVGDNYSEQLEEQTLISMYINDKLVTMPLTYSDLERQSLSVDYSSYSYNGVNIQDAFGWNYNEWITINDITGNELVKVYPLEHNSRVISNNDKIVAIDSVGSHKVRYFGLTTDSSTYDEVKEVIKGLGFNSIQYMTINGNEYIIGCVNINGNECQVWFEFFMFGEECVLESISIINASLCETGFKEGYGFKKIPYGEEVVTLTEDILSFDFKGVKYSPKSTIVDYVKNGWNLMAIDKSESGGQTILTLKKDNTVIEFYTTSMYVKKVNNNWDISENTVPTKIVLTENAMDSLKFLGITGVYSVNQIYESSLNEYVKEASLQGETGVLTATFENFGTAEISILDGYVNGLTLNYVR